MQQFRNVEKNDGHRGPGPGTRGTGPGSRRLRIFEIRRVGVRRGAVNKQGNQILKRAEFLSKICENKKTLAIAGTHGKTTTTSILTHIFSKTNQSFTSFMGGFFRNKDSNFVKTGLDNFIVEAD